MRSKIFIAAILFASLAQAKKPKHYRTGTLFTSAIAERLNLQLRPAVAYTTIWTTYDLLSHLEVLSGALPNAFVKPNANLRAMREPRRHSGQAESSIRSRSHRRGPRCSPQSPVLSPVG